MVNLPNNGVSLHLQKLFYLNYFIWFAILWLASVPYRCLENFGVLMFWFRDWGWALSPYKYLLNLDYCSNLMTNLGVGVCSFDEFYDLCGCEIVGWVSEESGCLWFYSKNDQHKFIWAYLGLVFDRALLMGDVDIYLCLVFLFIFRILKTTWFCFVLDWSEPQSIQNCWPDYSDASYCFTF